MVDFHILYTPPLTKKFDDMNDMKPNVNVMLQPSDLCIYSVTEGSCEEMSAEDSLRFFSFVPKHHLPLVVTHSTVCFGRFRQMKIFDL